MFYSTPTAERLFWYLRLFGTMSLIVKQLQHRRAVLRCCRLGQKTHLSCASSFHSLSAPAPQPSCSLPLPHSCSHHNCLSARSFTRWVAGSQVSDGGAGYHQLPPRDPAAEALDTINWLFAHYGASDYVGEPVSQEEHALQTAHFARQDRPEDPGFYVAALLHDVGHLMGLWALDKEKASSPGGGPPGGGSPEEDSSPPPHVKAVLEDVMTRKVERMGHAGIASHEYLAVRFCRRVGLPERVGVVASLHVEAKRYLCCVDKDYFGKLTPASVETLRHQGGPMTETERVEFENRFGLEMLRDVVGILTADRHGEESIILPVVGRKNIFHPLQVAMRLCDERGKQVGLSVPDLGSYEEAIQGLIATERLGGKAV